MGNKKSCPFPERQKSLRDAATTVGWLVGEFPLGVLHKQPTSSWQRRCWRNFNFKKLQNCIVVFDYGHVETICCLSAEELFRRAGLLRLPWILQRLKIVQYLLLQPPASSLCFVSPFLYISLLQAVKKQPEIRTKTTTHWPLCCAEKQNHNIVTVKL